MIQKSKKIKKNNDLTLDTIIGKIVNSLFKKKR